MIADLHSQGAPRKRRRARIQDEFTFRDDLTAAQKYQRRLEKTRVPHSHNHPRPSGIRGEGAMIAKQERTKLGLDLLQLVAIPGVPLTYDDIAVWCDCTRQNIESIAAGVLRKIRNHLMFRDPALWEELRLAFTNERQPARRRVTRFTE